MGRKAIYPYNIEVGEKAEFDSDKPLSTVKAAANAYGKKYNRAYQVWQHFDAEGTYLPRYTLERLS